MRSRRSSTPDDVDTTLDVEAVNARSAPLYQPRVKIFPKRAGASAA